MATVISQGFSALTDPQEAAYQACLQIKETMSVDCDLVILAASASYAKQEILDIIHTLLKPKHLMGTSCYSLINNDGHHARGINIFALASNDIHTGLWSLTSTGHHDFRQMGVELSRKAITQLGEHNRQIGFLIMDNLFANEPAFLAGIQEGVGLGFPLFGAVSGDDFTFKKTVQFINQEFTQHSASCLLLSGNTAVALSSGHGFKPLGKPRTVTSADGNILKTIDHMPAMKFYEHFLETKSAVFQKSLLSIPAQLYPMGLYNEEHRQYILKNAIDVLDDGSIVCQSEIAVGAEIHLMIANKESLRQSAINTATAIKESLAGKEAQCIFIIESAARLKILGRNVSIEIDAIKEILGATTPIFGFSTIGEIAPIHASAHIKKTLVHNENLIIVAIA